MIIIYPDYKNRITLHALNRINNSDMINYIYLALAIVAETVATTALKISEQFTRLWPSLTAVIGYAATFYLLSLSLRTIPIGVAYGLWGAIGIVLIASVGAIGFKQIPDLPAIIGMILIIAGVLIINLFSKMTVH